MENWKTLFQETVLTFGKWLRVEDRTVETPDGQVIEHWPWVTSPDYINVLPVTEDGQFIVFRQGKYGYEGESYAPVGGYIEPGEEALAAAKRELHEEIGGEAEEWLHLGHYLVDPNRGVAWGDFFLARGVRLVSERHADDLEEQQLLLLNRAELELALREERFRVLAWTTNIALALMALDRLEKK